MFALFSGLVGTAFSVLIRLELSGGGVQYIADNQLYNSIITAHAILMIFFMVKKYFILNPYFTLFKVINNNKLESNLNELDYNNKIYHDKNDENNNDKNNNDENNNKHNYVKLLVDDPYNNRDIILKVTKKQKGIYI
jgi:hypothetical protein